MPKLLLAAIDADAGGLNLTNPQGTTVPLPTPSNQKENNITIQQQEMHF